MSFGRFHLTAENDQNTSIAFNLNRRKSDPLLQADEAKKIEELIRTSNLIVSEVTQKPVKSKPKPPFITSTLQQAASTKLGFNVKRTMRTAQKLYENGLITYMRTDAPALSPESIADARMYIETNLGDKYLTNAPRIYSSAKMRKRLTKQLDLQMHQLNPKV